MGGGTSRLNGVGTQPWFGGTGITNNKVPVTPRRVTLPFSNEIRAEANSEGLGNAGEVETLSTCNLTGITATRSYKGRNKANKGRKRGELQGTESRKGTLKNAAEKNSPDYRCKCERGIVDI